MKVIIAGSRKGPTIFDVYKACNYSKLNITEVVSGTARGADQLGEQLAKEYDIPVKRFPANWDRYGKSAGYLRNKEMAEYADAAIILWDGESKGSLNMMEEMRKRGKPCWVSYINEDRIDEYT